MKSTPGYHNRYLHAQLDTNRVVSSAIPLSDEVLRASLGGSGLGTHLMLELNAGVQEEEGPIAFVFSPLVSSPITTSAKFAVVCKSPLTGRLNDALASSGFAIGGKATGHDAIVISGKLSQWSVLVIDDDQAYLKSADGVLGCTTTETESKLRAELGKGFDFAVIGPAGENQVRYASISHDGRHAGRGGSGAVLGAKRLKAIAVRGTQRCNWYDSSGLIAYSKQLSERSFGAATAKYRELGTATNLLTFNRFHALPTRNFQQSTFENVAAIAPETLTQTREKTRASCRACTIGCEHLYSLGSDDKGGSVRVEYENLFALGPLCGIGDPETVLYASKRCDELGLDTISTGGTIAFAMECAEKGYLDAPHLRFGKADAFLQTIELIAGRKGLGDRLANGTRHFAKELGSDAEKIAIHVKGLELPGYEPRTLQTMALGFAVGTRGADHNRSSAYEADFSNQVDRRSISDHSVTLAIDAEDRSALLDSLILCKFLRGVFEDIWSESTAMLKMVTGWDLQPDELRETARNIITKKKQFNVSCGWTPKEDVLPDRFFDEALPEDSAQLSRERLSDLIETYNLRRGWSPTGYPESES